MSPTAPLLAATFTDLDDKDWNSTELTLWDIDRARPRLRHRRSLEGVRLGPVVFEPDGQGLIFPECVSAKRQRYRTTRMDVETGACTVLMRDQWVSARRFIPGTRSLLVLNPPSIFDLDSETVSITFEKKTIQGARSIDVSPDGRYVAGGFGDFRARVWESTTPKQKRQLNRKGCPFVPTVAFSPDGTRLAVGPVLDGVPWGAAISVRRLTAKFPEETLLRANPTGNLYTLAYSPCSRFIACSVHDRGLRESELTATLVLWDVDSGKVLAQVRSHQHDQLAFSPNSQQLLAGARAAAAIDVYKIERLIGRAV